MSPLANCNIKVLRLKLKSIDVAKVKIYIFDWFLPLIYRRANAYMATPLTIIYFFLSYETTRIHVAMHL